MVGMASIVKISQYIGNGQFLQATCRLPQPVLQLATVTDIDNGSDASVLSICTQDADTIGEDNALPALPVNYAPLPSQLLAIGATDKFVMQTRHLPFGFWR